jgi:FSR family fosmidomycin resistance protein-like MFS transporter
MMNRRATLLLSFGHMFTDINQGAVPALLPFFVSAYGLSYQQVAGLVFAGTIASSVVQPLFGRYADRSTVAWLMPLGIGAAGVGLAFTGLFSNYWLMAAGLMLSGLGVAAFHPEAARSMNAAAGVRKATGMSVFSIGGTAGFAIGPLLATGLMLALGVRGVLWMALPATLYALVLFFQLRALPRLRHSHAPSQAAAPGGAAPTPLPDAWTPFGVLAAAVTLRSVLFFGFNTFLPLYWIYILDQSEAAGGAILSLWLGAGVIGALVGGRLCDRFGARRVGLLATLAMAPLVLMFVWVRAPLPATLLVLLMSILMALPGSGLIVLGQDLVPNHIGVASGVTIGLSVSVGGATAPLLGWMADRFGIPAALTSLTVVPLVIVLLLWGLGRLRPTP